VLLLQGLRYEPQTQTAAERGPRRKPLAFADDGADDEGTASGVERRALRIIDEGPFSFRTTGVGHGIPTFRQRPSELHGTLAMLQRDHCAILNVCRC
jgi:hypothetical protein